MLNACQQCAVRLRARGRPPRAHLPADWGGLALPDTRVLTREIRIKYRLHRGTRLTVTFTLLWTFGIYHQSRISAIFFHSAVAYQGIHFLCSALTCPVQARPCVYRFSYYVSYCDPHNKRETIFVSCDIVQIQVHDDTRILFARPAPPEGERRRRCVGRAAFRSTSTLSAKANGFVWLGGGRRSCGMVIGPQDCHCDLAALPPQRDCGRGQTCGHDSFLDRREAACRRRVRV